MISHDSVPTHIALVVRRLRVTGDDQSADTWLMASYVAECLLKTITGVFVAGIRHANPTIAHKLEYDLVRADGLGSWEQSIGTCSNQSFAGYLHSDLQPLVAWVTQRRTRPEDDWAREVAGKCAGILGQLEMPDSEVPPRFNVRFILSQLVRIRNKTKAHGAVGADFFSVANTLYLDALTILLEQCPICTWEWFHLTPSPEWQHVRAVRLSGLSPTPLTAEAAELFRSEQAGLHFRTHSKGLIFNCGEMLRANRECSVFRFPNGSYSGSGSAEFVDYATGRLEQVSLRQYLQPPAPLPASATEGAPFLDIFSNVFGNIPPRPERYVSRPTIEEELTSRILDRNHPIVTLHGRGGIGKTSLALHISHYLAEQSDCPYEYILWISARDLELKPSGATEVRRAVANLKTLCSLISSVLEIELSASTFAELLQDPSSITSTGILFIFDNFETLDNPREIHKFLDTHTHLPNKILITSRERAFKGDYPIEVEGMEYDEAVCLLKQEAAVLGIEKIMTDSVIAEVHDYTDGHPYVMRVLLGEIAREGRRIPLKSLVPRRSDLLDVVFERSFNKLSPDARWTFLCVANWRSAVPELALLVVLGLRELDAERGLDECFRFSLLTRRELADDSLIVSAPELARHFGRKKLDSDPDRLLIREDLEIIQSFGHIRFDDIGRTTSDDLVNTFVERSLNRVDASDEATRTQIDRLLTRAAQLIPIAWLGVARYREAIGAKPTDVDDALRRAVEEMPYSKETWLARAEYARKQGYDTPMIAALVSAVDSDPSDVNLIREVAFQLCKYVDSHKSEIPIARRGVYLASVREHMVGVAADLDATGLSRLAWLFLLENNQERAWEYANLGLARESTNNHCLSMVERLEQQGYDPKKSRVANREE